VTSGNGQPPPDDEPEPEEKPWVPPANPRRPVPRGFAEGMPGVPSEPTGTLNEAATRRALIDPALTAIGWREGQIDREYHYRAGRIFLVGDEPQRDRPQYVDYVLREQAAGVPLAILEAKDERHSPGAGLQQAVAYATDLGAPVAMSTNGHQYLVQDLRTGVVRELNAPPSPQECLGWQEGPLTFPAPNPLLEPILRDRPLRYYQERAVNVAVSAAMAGRTRCLLNLATGTGKTVIAANVSWKLWNSGTRKKILFLVDRVSLLGQAYNSFAAFGDARAIVGEEDELPLLRDVHFATYQSLYTLRGEKRLFEHYPRDYFDCILIDECHRSGYGDWSAILAHHAAAFKVGMTATPKRADSIDTYEYFGSENRDAEGVGQADYEYSLARGIEDGFLATYQVVKVTTNIDEDGLRIADELEQGAELFAPDDADLRDVYAMEQFERDISVPDRTRVLCEHLAAKIKDWGVSQKTIVFCVSNAHADLVRNEMQNLLGVGTGQTRYAVRIVSEERDSQALVEEFQDRRAREPVLATTVDLLSTGVDIPNLRNVVFMKPVSSPVVFKQIVGRGTRLDAASGKLFFRIVDYTNATRLFDAWDLPSTPDEPREEMVGESNLSVIVADQRTGEPIAGAQVLLTFGRRVVARGVAMEDGAAHLNFLPAGDFTLRVTRQGYLPVKRSVALGKEPATATVLLEEHNQASERLVISGVAVTLTSEVMLTLDEGGSQLNVQQYLDLAGRRIRDVVTDGPATLLEIWRDPQARGGLLQQLRDQKVDPSILALLLKRNDADPVDLLAHTGWGRALRSREERARHVEDRPDSVLKQLPEDQAEIFRALLDQYRVGGVEELDTAAVFRTPALVLHGGVQRAAAAFGGADGIRRALVLARTEVYRNGEVA
jgi:type I restriction enzyme R subunit